jgi:hypothetical protein
MDPDTAGVKSRLKSRSKYGVKRSNQNRRNNLLIISENLKRREKRRRRLKNVLFHQTQLWIVALFTC